MWASRATVLLLAVSTLVQAETSKLPHRPNLIYILNDDTDVFLGSPDVLTQTKALLQDNGATFTQFRTLSPKCTPSRRGQLVGRHYHNVRPEAPHPTWGGGLNQSTMFDADGLFPMLHSHGYLTSIVGKVHNGQKDFLCSGDNVTLTESFSHVSTLCSPCGNYWGNQYVVKEIGETGTKMESPLDPDAWSTYSHGQFSNRSTKFMREAVKAKRPFFAYIGTTGPHLPSIPAPWHEPQVRAWTHEGRKAPRTPNFNTEEPTMPFPKPKH